MKIIIVEDQVLFRELLHTICAAELGFEVVGGTGSGAAAIELLRNKQPDLALLDLVLADNVDGFEVAESALTASPATRLLGLSGNFDAYTLHRIEHSRMHGFVDKMSTTASILKEAITTILQGQCFYSERFKSARLARQTDPHWFARLLSTTEQQVLGLIGFGLSDEEIGLELGISPSTAQTHRSRILKKLSIPGTPKLIAFAVKNGFSHTFAPPRLGSAGYQPHARSPAAPHACQTGDVAN